MINNFNELKKFGLSSAAITLVDSYGKYAAEPRVLEEIKELASSCNIKMSEVV